MMSEAERRKEEMKKKQQDKQREKDEDEELLKMRDTFPVVVRKNVTLELITLTDMV
jgi:hypothetical protein